MKTYKVKFRKLDDFLDAVNDLCDDYKIKKNDSTCDIFENNHYKVKVDLNRDDEFEFECKVKDCLI